MPFLRGLLLGADPAIGIVVGLKGVVWNSVKQSAVRTSQSGCRSTKRGTDACGRIQLPADIRAGRCVVKGFVRNVALRIKARKLGEIIQPAKSTRKGSVLVHRSEIAAVDRIFQLRQRCSSAGGRSIDDAAQGVAAIQNAVRAAHYL